MATTSTSPTQHSVKQWHLESLGLLVGGPKTPDQIQKIELLQTRFSSWTPIENKSLNNKLFQERIRLINYWFDLWTDKQRKEFLHLIFTKCSKSQVKFAGKWLLEKIPVTKVDFTALLPRFISLYIFSFLNPKDLCAAAQVNWHWKFLTEQDCLWMPKCITLGWFLPYTPEKNEYGAWKQHYIVYSTDVDRLAPREATGTYGILGEHKTEYEDQQERLYAKHLRKIIRERMALHKKELLKARPPWLSGTRSSGFYRHGCQLSLSQAILDRTRLPVAVLLAKDVEEEMKESDIGNFEECQPMPESQSAQDLHKKRMPSSNDILSKHFSEEVKSQLKFSQAAEKELIENVAGSSFYPMSHRNCRIVSRSGSHEEHALQPHLILISSHVPAYEPGVIPIVYEPSSTTLESLLFYVQKALDGQISKSIGIFSNGNSRGLNLLQGHRISAKNLLKPEVRDFWEKLKSCVTSPEEGGTIDIFVPLAASEAGQEVLSQLSRLTGAFIRTPTGIATGSYQHKEGCVSSCSVVTVLSEWLGNQKDPSPPSLYFTEVKLQVWLRFTELLEDALKAVRKYLRPYFSDLQKNIIGKILGQIMSDTLSWAEFQDNQRIAQVLVDGLVELSRGNHPLKAALSSNRAILSYVSIQLIFTDILGILQLNRWFLDELIQRLNEWSPAQNLGDLFIKFGQQLQSYINFYNNYAVILKTIDKFNHLIFNLQRLLKANRYLIRTQDVAQLNCCSERITMPYRLYEHTHDLSLFLFNDILVITQRSISHKPFERISVTTHQFLAAITLHQLLVEDIPDSKYIKNAFLLQGPRGQWICCTGEDDKFTWLSALQRAITCSIEEDINCF
ncbi:hypothetical protein JD844_024558 [Phrynosoma platyrhinos]|uniref:F-box domain-containing protein n=1 Tax=Phrynosoma platyrhinos TaxID=52577 RepID=A0ABQ7SZ55_PHRPL|nr:hypothetical protein JD844_024558 [Phrynosoma platyrhinos]